MHERDNCRGGILHAMTEILERLERINAQWDEGKFNVLKGLKILRNAVHGSDLLPGDVSMDTLESLAVGMYKNKRTFEETVEELRISNLKQTNSTQLTQQSLCFVAPKESALMDAGHIFSNLVELKQPNIHAPQKDHPIFIETITTTERLQNQLIIEQSVEIDGMIYKRTPCCKGRPGDGYIGCSLYQIDELINGSLGIYLSKEEVDIFYQTGAMPLDSENRVCILCYSQMLTCRAALFGAQGIGNTSCTDQTMFYQDLVNCTGGFMSKFMILPGNGGIYPPAPFLSFHPRMLRVSTRGKNLFVDESAMWFRESLPGFREGATC